MVYTLNIYINKYNYTINQFYYLYIIEVIVTNIYIYVNKSDK